MYLNLKLQLWKTGIRQNRLARMLEIDETALSKIVNGFREPTGIMREKIAAALSCDPAWLFARAEEAERQSEAVKAAG